MPYSLIMEGSLRGLQPNPLPACEQWMLWLTASLCPSVLEVLLLVKGGDWSEHACEDSLLLLLLEHFIPKIIVLKILL